MANEHLRAAITHAGLTLEEFADIVAVDIKTVQRWLGGRTPYPRHRASVAGALDTTEHALWPEAVPPPAAPAERGQSMAVLTDVVAGYGYATDRDAPAPVDVLRSASKQIALIIPSLVPSIADLLLAKAATGCRARAIIKDPDAEVEPLLGAEGIEVHTSRGGEHHDVYRADELMLLALRRISLRTDSPPVIVLQRRTSAGLFDRLADDFEQRWEQTTPLPTRESLHAYLAMGEFERRPEHSHDPAPDRRSLSPSVTPVVPGADAPRRWPGRRT